MFWNATVVVGVGLITWVGVGFSRTSSSKLVASIGSNSTVLRRNKKRSGSTKV